MSGRGACREVVVTGLGAVSALGADAPACYRAAVAGTSAIEVVEVDAGPDGPPGHRVPLARISADIAEVVDARCRPGVGALLDSFARLALSAATEALSESRLPDTVLSTRTAVIFGHGTGGTESLEAAYSRFFGQKTPKLHPLTIPRGMVSSAASAIAMVHRVQGPVFATSSACSSSGHAIAQAAMMIRSGAVDAAIVGGSESITTAGLLRCWEGMHAMSNSTCRPFSADRDGMVIGEGGAALVLEEAGQARARGARIYGTLLGEGCTSDAYHLTKPSLEGPCRAIKQALDAETEGLMHVLVSAHGTGTPLNDSNEASAIRWAMADLVSSYRVIATKSGHGHLLGASSALQVVIALLSARAGMAPPILNFAERDPLCDLPLVVGQAEPFSATHVLSNSFAFGGLNVSLLFDVQSKSSRSAN